ncbi:hypothetical protein A3B42_04425 [Candidatus Daviesbacteria bacterium RIFCSPLOWO2_01_FULL_38_10]|nr:MAG: hypothetical protein A3B42_04425 [Candidatus Daviesbacteria bacterium RIFCSPLOWO2_01_FULL_38_10]OGE44302.1 MAG: hypothetical protein A3E67_01365 [Candidatus Daviesbacteria bacterium RIFCSPHIGHO2_12_FULL_38_25]HCB23151.1 hypothetical protein [Candidatus Daviesbacteria bacterium]
MSLQITLTKSQWARISEILGNGGLLGFGSIVIPAVFDIFNWMMIVLGLLAGSTLIYLSILSARRYKL